MPGGFNWTPEQIIASNRDHDPGYAELVDQVTSLARMIQDARREDDRLDARIDALGPPREAFQLTRPLDTDFIIHATRDVLVFYTIELMVTATLLGANNTNADVVLNVDQVPTTESKNLLTCVLLLGLSFSAVTHRKVLSGYIRPGQTCNLTTSGAGSKTFIAGQEIFL